MPRPPLWYCRQIELFADLSEEEIMEIVSGAIHRECPIKQILYTPDDHLDFTYVLKEGEVTLYKITDGKKIIIDILKPGSIFGNIGFSIGDGKGVFAEASQRSFICTLPQDLFLKLLQKKPKVAVRAFSILSKRIAQYQSQLQFLSSLNAQHKILATIELLNKKDEQSILPPILRKRTVITHEKLASMTGLTRETVTKQLKKLVQEGLITLDKKYMRLTQEGWNLIESIK